MHSPKTLGIAFAAALLVCLATPVALHAQNSSSQAVTQGDIQRLQDVVYDTANDIGRLRSSDPARADELQGRLDDLRDQVIYLKVKLRKEGVTQSEYTGVRRDLDDLRWEVRRALPASQQPQPPDYGNPNVPAPPPAPATRPSSMPDTRQAPVDRGDVSTAPARQGTTTRPNEIPADTEIDVRLEDALSSSTAQVEDRFNATTVADLYNGNRVLVPAGSTVRGVVTAVTKAGRIERTGKLTIGFDRMTVNGRSFPMHATVTEALQSGGYRQDAGKIGAGAGVGAIIGGILGGLKGALAGILIGGGGVVAATEGQDVNLPAGTVLRIRLDSPLDVR